MIPRSISTIIALAFAVLTEPAISGCRGVSVQEGVNLSFGQLRYQADIKNGWISISPDGAISTSRGISVSATSVWRPGTVQLKLPARSETLIRLHPIADINREDNHSKLDLEIHSRGATITKLTDDTFSVVFDQPMDDRGQSSTIELILTGTLFLQDVPQRLTRLSHRLQITCLSTTVF